MFRLGDDSIGRKKNALGNLPLENKLVRCMSGNVTHKEDIFG
jgi:hypothetical protein